MRMSQRVAAASGLAALTVALTAGVASAHVTANPSTAEPGSYSKVSFRVPNEQQSADTTKVEIDLPADHPIASVSVRPQPGWNVKVEKAKLATPLKSDDAEITQAARLLGALGLAAGVIGIAVGGYGLSRKRTA